MTKGVRRRELFGGGATVALGLLAGCSAPPVRPEPSGSVLATCSAQPGGVAWTPDVARPVFWGYQEAGPAQGAPSDLIVYYPAYDSSPEGAPVLGECGARWPVVLFLHGAPPGGVPSAGYHRRWSLLPSILARCGYVVVAPGHDAAAPTAEHAAALAGRVTAAVTWVRTRWTGARWVDPAATAVAGHGNGALLAARMAAAGQARALISLGGGFRSLADHAGLLRAVTVPSLFMWAAGAVAEDLDGRDRLWEALSQPRYAAVYDGRHLDYLRAEDSGDAPRGACPLIGGVAGDLAALFLGAHMPVSPASIEVPVDLRVPKTELTQRQEFFAGAHLSSVRQAARREGCRVGLRWKVGQVAGERRVGG